MAMQLGYTMMTEQAGPRDLVGHVVGAEEVGFDFAVSSDHYFPWLDEMGHSPNAWVTLGAAAQTRAHSLFRWFGLGWKVNAELPGPTSFDAASQFVREEDVDESIPCGDDVDAVLGAAKE